VFGGKITSTRSSTTSISCTPHEQRIYRGMIDGKVALL
jgi:hypothetical protein